MLKLMNTNVYEVGSIEFQQAMEHNIFAKLLAGETLNDLTSGEQIFLDIQVDHIKRTMDNLDVQYISNKCPQGFEELDDEKFNDLKDGILKGTNSIDLTPCMECPNSCVVKSAMED